MAPRRCAQTDSTVSPPTSIALAIATTMSTLVLGHLAFGRVTCSPAGFVGGLLLWLLLPNRGSWADIGIPYFIAPAQFLAHRVGSRKSRRASSSPTSEVTALPSPAVASVSVILLLLVSVWRVAAHPGPDDEGTGIRLLPGLGVLRVAGHHRTRSFRCASRSSTNRATATFPQCGRSSCLPRWRGWACGAGPRHT